MGNMIEATPKVSVVSITYNQEKYIKEALESFVMQRTNFKFEVIICDDASTDSTADIIREYTSAYPEIFKPVLRRKNLGVVSNFVDALRLAKGKYIALCEGDDFWIDSDKIQQQADFLDKNPEYALCFHRAKVFTEGSPDKDLIFPDPKDKTEFTLKELLARNFIQTNTVMYRRQNYSKMPKDILPLDWYLHLYHAQFGKIGFINEVKSAYRKHPGGIWWGTETDLDQIWKKYGLSHLALYEAMLDLYGKDDENRSTINQSIVAMLNNLIDYDSKHGDNLLLQAIERFPSSAEMFIKQLLMENEALRVNAHPAAVSHHPSAPYGVRGASRELIHALKRSFRSRIRK